MPPTKQEAQAGAEITIAKSGEPYTRLAALEGRVPKRESGTLKGLVALTDSFFEPLPVGWNGEN